MSKLFTGQEVWYLMPTWANGYNDRYQNGVVTEYGKVVSVGPELVCICSDEGEIVFAKHENVCTDNESASDLCDKINKEQYGHHWL